MCFVLVCNLLLLLLLLLKGSGGMGLCETKCYPIIQEMDLLSRPNGKNNKGSLAALPPPPPFLLALHLPPSSLSHSCFLTPFPHLVRLPPLLPFPASTARPRFHRGPHACLPHCADASLTIPPPPSTACLLCVLFQATVGASATDV